jgi:hypothetical protein
MKKLLPIVILLVAVLPLAQAVLYRYEAFNYTANTGLRTVSGFTAEGSAPFATNRAVSLIHQSLPLGLGGKLQIPGISGLTGYL